MTNLAKWESKVLPFLSRKKFQSLDIQSSTLTDKHEVNLTSRLLEIKSAIVTWGIETGNRICLANQKICCESNAVELLGRLYIRFPYLVASNLATIAKANAKPAWMQWATLLQRFIDSELIDSEFFLRVIRANSSVDCEIYRIKSIPRRLNGSLSIHSFERSERHRLSKEA